MTLSTQLKEDLKRLTRLASNISEAHTCALFLPTGLLSTVALASGTLASSALSPAHLAQPSVSSPISKNTPGMIELRTVVETPESPRPLSIEMVAAHSVAATLTRDCRIQVGSGLLGWVAESGRPIHITPFDADSSTVGIYSESQQLKSLAALPVPMPAEFRDAHQCHGVLMCDSTRSLSFTKAQVKHLEDLTTEISRLLFWSLFKRDSSALESSLESFIARSEDLGSAIGSHSVELLRVSYTCSRDAERSLGLTAAVRQTDQFFRLVQQALPPHFPIVRLPQGEILIALDNMMSVFFQNKIRSIYKTLAGDQVGLGFALEVFSTTSGGCRSFDVDSILRSSTTTTKTEQVKALGGVRA